MDSGFERMSLATTPPRDISAKRKHTNFQSNVRTPRECSDRFIPRRIDFDSLCDMSPRRTRESNYPMADKNLRHSSNGTNNNMGPQEGNAQESIGNTNHAGSTYELVLRSELFGASTHVVGGSISSPLLTPVSPHSNDASHNNTASPSSTPPRGPTFGHFLTNGPIGAASPTSSPPRSISTSSPTSSLSSPTSLSFATNRVLSYSAGREREQQGDRESAFSQSPISKRSQKLLRAPPKTPRKIPSNPVRILEAPAIKDDFYLNLLDWSANNILAVGLGTCVYLWNGSTSSVVKLCDLSNTDDTVTSVKWDARGTYVAVGTNKGLVQQWDPVKGRKLREVSGHKSRVGALAWRENVLTSGSRDRAIFNRDMRDPAAFTHKMFGHRQEVCGLEWSPDLQFLASGGNDNRLMIWDVTETKPLQRYTQHSAAVKAIAWSPHQRGLLASGGGTADRCIRFWDVATQSRPLQCIDTGSQVCNLAWSKNVNEIVSTHGYSQNQIALWSYPDLRLVTALTGHTTRVLYLSVSPDGQTIVTGAGDETLRFWDVFPSSSGRSKYHDGLCSSLSADPSRSNIIR